MQHGCKHAPTTGLKWPRSECFLWCDSSLIFYCVWTQKCDCDSDQNCATSAYGPSLDVLRIRHAANTSENAHVRIHVLFLLCSAKNVIINLHWQRGKKKKKATFSSLMFLPLTGPVCASSWSEVPLITKLLLFHFRSVSILPQAPTSYSWHQHGVMNMRFSVTADYKLQCKKYPMHIRAVSCAQKCWGSIYLWSRKSEDG